MNRQELNAAASKKLAELKATYKTSQQQSALRALVGAAYFESIDAVMRRHAMRLAMQAAA